MRSRIRFTRPRIDEDHDAVRIRSPTLEDGSVDPRFAITPAKRYLGKMQFFDPTAGRFMVRRRVRPGLADILPTPIEMVVDGEIVFSGRWDGGQFFHSGGSRSVREVVRYFCEGRPLDAEAAAVGNLSRLFTQPSGSTGPPGRDRAAWIGSG